MSKRDDLRGYLLAIVFGADDPLSLSSEDVHEVFASDYPNFDDFQVAFETALQWLEAEKMVRYQDLYSGTNNETCVPDMVATAEGEKAVTSLTKAADRSGGLHIELARMIGAGLGEFANTQSGR